MTMTHDWQPYTAFAEPNPHTITGTVLVLPELISPQLENTRPILLYLPPSYTESERRYPVIYMHDGQNLFDAQTSYSGEWHVDETMEYLAQEGCEAIVVGVPNMGSQRLDEYSPFVAEGLGGGKGDQYLAFLVETLKPVIDRDFRTLPDRDHTLIAGSSMGGLISLYALFRYPEVFGVAGSISPALWFARSAIFSYIEQAAPVTGRVYLDVGTREVAFGERDPLRRRTQSQRYVRLVRRMRRLLHEKGIPAANLHYVEARGASHSEAAWAHRLPDALRFLLAVACGD